jgi:hypothetical protein
MAVPMYANADDNYIRQNNTKDADLANKIRSMEFSIPAPRCRMIICNEPLIQLVQTIEGNGLGIQLVHWAIEW